MLIVVSCGQGHSMMFIGGGKNDIVGPKRGHLRDVCICNKVSTYEDGGLMYKGD